jgi:hypothetical protein
MNKVLFVWILLVSTMPLHAQGQQPDTAKLKADAQNVISIISGDKTKKQTYCQINTLEGQADQEKDVQKATALHQQITDSEKDLGPEYVALIDSLGKMDPTSRQEIVSTFDTLDASCP